MRIETSIEQEQERLDFAKRAVEFFAKQPDREHYSLADFAPGDLMAFRRDGGVLVVRLGDEPFVHYLEALPPQNVELTGMIQPRDHGDRFSVAEGLPSSDKWHKHDRSTGIPKGLHAGQWAYVRLVNGSLWHMAVTKTEWTNVTHYIRAPEPGGPPVLR